MQKQKNFVKSALFAQLLFYLQPLSIGIAHAIYKELEAIDTFVSTRADHAYERFIIPSDYYSAARIFIALCGSSVFFNNTLS